MGIPVTTTLSIEGYRIKEYKGVVRGITVRSPTVTQGILGGLRSIIGGRIGAYTEMCEQARQQAYDLMIQYAREVGPTLSLVCAMMLPESWRGSQLPKCCVTGQRW